MSRKATKQRERSGSESPQSSSTRSPSPSARPDRDTESETSDVTIEIFPTPSGLQERETVPTPSHQERPNHSSTADLARASPLEPTDGEIVQFALALTTAQATPLPPSPTLNPKKQKSPKKPKQQNSSIPTTLSTMPANPIPLLICSIGNPGAQYANTLHSAGHTVLAALASYISAPSFQKDRSYANGLVSPASFSSSQPQWTLFQSPSYMNESGKPIAKAFATWNRSLAPGEAGKVVVIHDELEKPLGSVSVREGQGLSARGHNGIKSLLQQMGKTGFVRVGVGIGRPVGRSPDEVAGYVLKKMSPVERMKLEGAVGEVYERLRGVSG